MNTTITKLWMTVTITAVAGTIGIVGVAGAAPTDPASAPSGPRGDRAAVVCEHLEQIEARLTDQLDRIAARQTWLADKRSEAVEAGRERQVEHIDAVTGRLTERTTKVHERQSRLESWAAEHCPSA